MANPKCRLERDPPTAEALELAKNELRETPEVVQEALKKLRELIENDPTINFRTDDEILIIFLRPCKYYPESALALMKRVADFKDKHTMISNMMPDDEKSAMIDHKIVNVIANRDHKGRRVLIANIGGAWDTKQISGDQIFRLFYLIHVGAMLEPETQIRGVVVILDFENLGMRQVAQLTPSFSMRLLSFIQEAMPLRLKEVHIVKQPFIFNVVWKVFQPFVREKLKSRLFFHGSKMDSLHKHLDPSHLPANYGGKLPAFDYSSADWFPVLKSIDSNVSEWNSWGNKK
ncbi:clavesin-1 [Halyomorpha halys]|uniref:clavesin-1 n=1 Tax=Halyomorpha halys TaxID=286706 RepID=UPI000D0C82BB|nr:clavesin-1 [Halyomorpha halys]